MAQAAPDGLIAPGNIDIHHRPVAHNPDGSISTVRSISVDEDGKSYLIPTVSPDGRVLSNKEAIDLFHRTGQNLGVFKTYQQADAYAQNLHNEQAQEYAKYEKGGSIPDPVRSLSLQNWLGTPGARAMYDQAPTQFWQHYNDLSNPKPQETGELGMLRAMQQDPTLMATYQKLHPRDSGSSSTASSGDGGADALLTDDAKSLMAAGLSHGYSIPLPSFGIGAAGAQAKAQALNQLAASIKTSGVPWDDAISNMLQGKTATAGLTDVQKSAAKVNAWENSASKQADITLGLSNQVDRTGVPLFNKWTLAGRQATGDVEVAKFNNSVATLAEEYARVMGGGNSAATDSTRELAHTMLNSAMTQDQFKGVVSLMKQEMATRKNALSESVDQTRGTIVGKKADESGPASSGWAIQKVSD